MSAFTLDIAGQLNSIKLSESKALWPLFETIVNSIQSIEDSPNKSCGQITIFAQRSDSTYQTSLPNQIEHIESFIVTDNGCGFNSENYKSFNTAYSTFKIKKGCKGIGRFLWLKAFASVNVHSIYSENNCLFERAFDFGTQGIDFDSNTLISGEEIECKTKITLKNMLLPYKDKIPVELDVIAKKIIEHCLLFFISDMCPKIILTDGIDTINLNQYFNTTIKDTLIQDRFEISDHSFTIYHLKLPEGATKHELHLCADMHEVNSVDLKSHIPDLNKKIISTDDPVGFYYVGYLTGEYLDSIADASRTNFNYDEKNGQISISGTGQDSLVSVSIKFITAYLLDYIADIKKKTKKQVDNFVANENPTYRYLLKQYPEVYDYIPSGLSNDKLELELHKQVQKWERELKVKGQELEEANRKVDSLTPDAYQQLFDTYWAGVTELSKTCLAEYVTRRKSILHLLEDTLTVQDNGKFKKEDAIHSIICPMRHTSDDVAFKEMNLWIIDERLAYHQFLASDKTIKSLPDIDSNSTKEVDIAVFDRAFAFSGDDAPLNTITIIEFKKPDNQKDNPLNQMGKYIDEIVSGQKKRANGLSFGASGKTQFRCFAICDMSPKMESNCKNAGLSLMPDGMGYCGYHPQRNAYYEVISYPKLLADAKKRNQILFDKLFAPNPNEIINK